MSPYKDPNKQRDYQRNWARSRVSTKASKSEPGLKWRLETADDLKGVLEAVVSELMGAEDLDLGVKGRVIASLLSVGVKLLEVGNLEERLSKLEAKMA